VRVSAGEASGGGCDVEKEKETLSWVLDVQAEAVWWWSFGKVEVAGLRMRKLCHRPSNFSASRGARVGWVVEDTLAVLRWEEAV
jgi:hypothetical protein